MLEPYKYYYFYCQFNPTLYALIESKINRLKGKEIRWNNVSFIITDIYLLDNSTLYFEILHLSGTTPQTIAVIVAMAIGLTALALVVVAFGSKEVRRGVITTLAISVFGVIAIGIIVIFILKQLEKIL